MMNTAKTLCWIVLAALAMSPLVAGADTPTSQPADETADETAVVADSSADVAPTPARQPMEKWLDGPGITGEWFGLRPFLDDHGVNITGSFVMDSVWNYRGGLSTNQNVMIEQFFVNLDVHTEPLIGLPGGRFHITYQSRHGRPASGTLTGDALGILCNDGGPQFYYGQIGEMYYEQTLGKNLDGDKPLMRIKIGKSGGGEFLSTKYFADFLTTNEQPAYTEYLAGFLNAAIGWDPTIVGQPTSPSEAFGVSVFIAPYDWLYMGFAIYDGSSSRGVDTGQNGIGTFFDNPGDYFLMQETGFQWEHLGQLGEGHLAFGVWGNTAEFDKYSGGTRRGAAGPYVLLDQQLFKPHRKGPNDKRELRGFVQWGWADPEITNISQYVGWGLRWIGLIPTRDHDMAGIAMSCGGFSDVREAGFTKDWEINIEAFYRIEVTPWLHITPDLQYIINPGGQGLPDALAGILRLELSF